MEFLSRFGVAQKVMGGFGILALVILVTVVLTIYSVSDNQKINQRVFDVRLPTVLNTAQMVGGINYSLAALRGYMILGTGQFKDQRAEAWRDIREYESNMEAFARSWTNPENVRRFREVSERLDVFEAAQAEVESLSHTIDETPATRILVEEAAPRAAIIVQEITRMINLEADQAATAERKDLLGMMADVRGSMGMALANIRAYLLTGDEQFSKEFDGFWATNERRFNDLDESSRLLTREQRSAFDRLKDARREFAPLPPRMFDIRGSEKWNMANYVLGTKAAPEALQILKLLSAMEANQETLASDDVELAKKESSLLINELIILGVVALAIAIFVAIVITRMVVVPVREVAAGLKAIAQGDLRLRFSTRSNDELGDMIRDLDAMSESLSGIVGNIADFSEQVGAAAEQISNGNLDLSQRTEEQASALEETASSIEEMTSTIKGNAESAQAANQAANQARDEAEKGGTVVSRAVEAMGEINKASGEISAIISVIDSISFQTNLLALNAAVEAARAGEQGRGFAVVAAEVRTLAQRSADSAKEIKDLIENSVQKVKVGTELVDESGETLKNIVERIKEVAVLVNEIDAASREQASGIDQINQAITQMDDMTQQNAALVEESAAASRAMVDQTVAMDEMMDFFKLERTALARKKSRSTQVQHTQPSRQPTAASRPTPAAMQQKLAARSPGQRTPVMSDGKDSDSGWDEF